MTKKGHQKLLPRKSKFFSQKRHSEILGPPKNVLSPQTRRQVSATVYNYLITLLEHLTFSLPLF